MIDKEWEGMIDKEWEKDQWRTIQNDWIQNHHQSSQTNINVIIQFALRAESVEFDERANEWAACTKQHLIANILYA